MNYLKKGKIEFRSDDRSHIARPKRGDLPCQLVAKILAVFLYINIEIFKMCLCVYSNIISH